MTANQPTPPEGVIIATREGIGYIACWPPIECSCGRMVAFAVNRGGQTRCLECDNA